MSLKMIGENLTYLMRMHGIDASRLSSETGIGIATINNLRKGGESHDRHACVHW